jgi:hypothetical protein
MNKPKKEIKHGDIITALHVSPSGSTIKETFKVHLIGGTWYIQNMKPNTLGEHAVDTMDVLEDALIFCTNEFPYRVDTQLNTFVETGGINIVDDEEPEKIREYLEEYNINPRFCGWADMHLCCTQTEEPFPVYRKLYPPSQPAPGESVVATHALTAA